MIEFYAKEDHFADHIRPIQERVQEMGFETSWVMRDERGTKGNRFAVVSSWGDLVRASKDNKMVFFCEHGAGQSYSVRNASYAGGPNRENVCMFLSPGPHVAAQNKRFYPDIPNAEVGVPKLDKRHLNNKDEPAELGAIPTVCFSFHWDCGVCPETGSGFEYFRDAVLKAAQSDEYEVIGHCHPRARKMVLPFYKKNNIEYVEDFEEVMDRADVYVCDNSSTIFEFASIGKPVVLLNPPFYRPFVNHGLRFWEMSGIGPNASTDSEVLRCIREALNDTAETKKARNEYVKRIYHATDGEASTRAANAILEFVEEFERVEREGNYLKCTRFCHGQFGMLDKGQTILMFPSYAIVNDTFGCFRRRAKLPTSMPPCDRIRQILRMCPNNYELVEPDLALLTEESEEDFSGKGKDFVPANKELCKEELYIIKMLSEGASKTKAVYKSKEFSVAALQRAWIRLETDEIIVPGEKQFTWEVRRWGL